tara:strand:+ start:130 stop:441 length:312 start_codon:yes stop_codon:yes gene_type:complete
VEVEEVATPRPLNLEILVDLVVEQTIMVIQDLQVKDPRTHHLVEQLDLINMEIMVVMDLMVQSIIMVVAAVPVALVVMLRQVLDQMQQVMEEMVNHSLDLLDL